MEIKKGMTFPIPIDILNDTRLSMKARILFCYICLHCQETTPKDIKKDLGFRSDKEIDRCIQRLCKTGWLVKNGENIIISLERGNLWNSQ